MPTYRKDVKDMTSEEKERFIKALLELKRKKSGKVGSIYDEFIAIHGALMDLFANRSRATLLNMGHRRASFLTWHRHFLLRLEEELKNIDEKVFLPYWDWTSEESTRAVFSADFLGTPVNGGISAVELKDGHFRGNTWTDLDKKPLKRNNGSISNLIDQQKRVFDLLLTSSKTTGDSAFLQFSSQLESIHDFAHVWVGGHMSSIGTAVADPIFFLNHCNVDRFFAMWQDFGNLESFPSNGQSYGNNKNDGLWPWDGGRAMPEADRLRDYIRDADPNYIITNAGMLNYRTWRYSYDKPMGALETTKQKKIAKLEPWGPSHIWDLEIKETANYRIYTNGATDVQMEVYGPALCANCFGQLKASDDNSGDGGVNPSVSITLQPGKYFVVIRTSVLGKGGEYNIFVSQRNNAIRLTLERPFRAALSAMWEIDWYEFQIEKEGIYIIETGGGVDTMLLLYGKNVPTDLIARDDNSGVNKNAQIKMKLTPGQYHVALRSANTSIGKYTIVLRQ